MSAKACYANILVARFGGPFGSCCDPPKRAAGLRFRGTFLRVDPERTRNDLTAARKGDSGKGLPSRPFLRKRRRHFARDRTGDRVLYFSQVTSPCA